MASWTQRRIQFFYKYGIHCKGYLTPSFFCFLLQTEHIFLSLNTQPSSSRTVSYVFSSTLPSCFSITCTVPLGRALAYTIQHSAGPGSELKCQWGHWRYADGSTWSKALPAEHPSWQRCLRDPGKEQSKWLTASNHASLLTRAAIGNPVQKQTRYLALSNTETSL